ncbi:hypothetical protein ACVIGB_000003 [Bradyrhizobium sp. USDA 4341]
MTKLKTIIASLALALALPFTATAGGLISLEPGPVDFSGSFDGKASDDGRVLQLVAPGTHPWFISPFFKPSQYRIDCLTPYVLTRAETAKSDLPEIHEYRVCRILDAPVVPGVFLDQLKQAGFRYTVSFGYSNAHNQRALVFWTSGRAERGRPPTQQGFARIEGVDWRDQYQPAARCVDADGKCSWRYFEHGDAFGAFINRFSKLDRDASARTFQEVGFDPRRREAVTGASIAIDAWLSEPAKLDRGQDSACPATSENTVLDDGGLTCGLAKRLPR